MLDVDNNNIITQHEFISALQDNKNIHEKVRYNPEWSSVYYTNMLIHSHAAITWQVKAGVDQDGLLTQLYDYLVDNEAVLADYFRQYDKDKSGENDCERVTNSS